MAKNSKKNKAMALYNALTGLGYNCEIENSVIRTRRNGDIPAIIVSDYSHSDCEGNEIIYFFDPETGDEIFPSIY